MILIKLCDKIRSVLSYSTFHSRNISGILSNNLNLLYSNQQQWSDAGSLQQQETMTLHRPI
ncbi:unnamed protein product [Brugia pahangi]|uniref:Uncharacterized protein n=1 Tax=Brugia pahangi TaxID=6280 RepID=A0A0N4TRI7_BRUPA|nr:unnamed protein product [Brugia pahangi]